MRMTTIRTLTAVGLALALSVPAFASSTGHGSVGATGMKGMEGQGGGMEGMGMKGMGGQKGSAMMGREIRTARVNGYTLTYRLIDMKQRMAMMKGMKGMDMAKMKSHHLMVFVTGLDGKAVTDAKVGFKIQGPAGAQVPEQRVMCMAMSGGFGADVELGAKGAYTVKAKIVAGDTKLVDSFTYEVK